MFAHVAGGSGGDVGFDARDDVIVCDDALCVLLVTVLGGSADVLGVDVVTTEDGGAAVVAACAGPPEACLNASVILDLADDDACVEAVAEVPFALYDSWLP